MATNKTVFFLIGILLIVLGASMLAPYALQVTREEGSHSFLSASFVTTGSVSFSELFKLNLFLSNNISDNVIFESPIKLSKKFFSLSEID